ncbi:DUF3429 domain-containing protein [Sabulicella rubraurantiaca]|uniref:DUF3429 domain-containing protein n=1 Tax=Sabulicella rubraurantiaca TaxID=2811429 RepID=UPI001A95BEEA|nr:DUF3429 domain-containing protein [Sabulicella rubraurantiaca]
MMEAATMRLAWTLGLLGLLPFAGLALVALAVTGWHDWALMALRAYGAVILSFLGAVHWGVALRAPEAEAPTNRQRLSMGVLPALVGWAALLLPIKSGLWLLAAALVAVAAVEQWASLRGFVSGPYVVLRWVLSLSAGACLLAAALA